MKTLLLYLPVLHKGYFDLIDRHMPDRIIVLGQKYLELLEYLSRDARALSPRQNAVLLKCLLEDIEKFSKIKVYVLNDEFKPSLLGNNTIILPDEDITRLFAEKHLAGKKIIWDTAFIRWNMQNVTTEFPVDPDEEISEFEFDRQMMALAKEESKKSPDWWRQVGALILFKDKTYTIGCNEHTPHSYISYFEGDSRTPFKPGERIDISLAEHAEALLIAEVARLGVSLAGTSIYVTCFPCPACARLIISSGIKVVYFSEGYSLVNARLLFKQAGVRVVRVK